MFTSALCDRQDPSQILVNPVLGTCLILSSHPRRGLPSALFLSCFILRIKVYQRKWGSVTSESQCVRRKIIVNIAECRDARQLLIHNAVGFLVSGNKLGPSIWHTLAFADISTEPLRAN